MALYMKNTTYAKCGNFGQNSFTSASLLLAGLFLAGGLEAAQINRLDVIVADSQATIYAVSLQTGQRAIIAQQDKLDRPYDLARNRDGNIIVSDTGTLRIVQVNPLTGQQAVLAEGPALGVPYGLDVDQNNRIYVANSSAILSVAPATGLIEVVAQGGLLQVPLDVAVGADGTLYVADAVAGIIRIDAASKTQSLLAQGGFLHSPVGITVDDKHTAYVVDSSGRCIVAVDTQSGAQKLVSMAGFFTTPVGIALAPGGTMLVSDPDAFNLDGGILMIGGNGAQSPVVQGSGELVNPRGIALVPAFVDATFTAKSK